MLELITDKYYGGIIVEEYGISLENGIPAGAENMLSAGGILLLSAFIVLTQDLNTDLKILIPALI